MTFSGSAAEVKTLYKCLDAAKMGREIVDVMLSGVDGVDDDLKARVLERCLDWDGGENHSIPVIGILGEITGVGEQVGPIGFNDLAALLYYGFTIRLQEAGMKTDQVMQVLKNLDQRLGQDNPRA